MDNMELKLLREELAQLRKQNDYLCDRAEIENLIGRYCHLHSSGKDRLVLETLMSKSDSTTYEDGASGVYELHGRIGGIAGCFQKFFGMSDDASVKTTPEPGRMHGAALSSPVIEIAEDRMTAKGLWMSSGFESRVYPAGESSGIPSIDRRTPDSDGVRHACFWVWSRVAADFIREDGQWRIWHLHIYDIFRSPYDTDWVTYAKNDRCADDEAADAMVRCCVPCVHATLPTKFHWQYSSDTTMPDEPQLPSPYATFSETFSY